MSQGIMLRSVVSKSFLKSTLLLAVFSVFLEVTPSKVLDYFVFVALWYGLTAFYAFSKRGTLYTISDEGITVKPYMRPAKVTKYNQILDLSYSQGMLAKRFNCGTIYIVLNVPGGRARLFGGGTAELLRDVKDPARVIEDISSRLSPFGATSDMQ